MSDEFNATLTEDHKALIWNAHRGGMTTWDNLGSRNRGDMSNLADAFFNEGMEAARSTPSAVTDEMVLAVFIVRTGNLKMHYTLSDFHPEDVQQVRDELEAVEETRYITPERPILPRYMGGRIEGAECPKTFAGRATLVYVGNDLWARYGGGLCETRDIASFDLKDGSRAVRDDHDEFKRDSNCHVPHHLTTTTGETMSAHHVRTYKQALFEGTFYYLPKAKFYTDNDVQSEDDFENPMRAEVTYADGAHDDSPYGALVISDWGNRLDVILAETHADADNVGKALMEKIAEETGGSIEEHDLSYYVFERD